MLLLLLYTSYTYENVHQNADKVWHWQNFNLVREFEGKSWLPAPLSIFSHMLHVGIYVKNKLTKKNKNKNCGCHPSQGKGN